MARKKTIVIFGVSSFLGSNLADFLKKDYKVVGTYHKTPIMIKGVFTLPCDVMSKDEIQYVLYTAKPDIVVYTVGYNSVLDCADSKLTSDALNTLGLFNVTDIASRYRAQVVYFSSHYVFSGEKKLYKEMEAPDANSILGRTKASAEFYLQKTSLNYLIFRCSHIYGRSINPSKRTFFETLEHNLHNGISMWCDHSLYCGFLDVSFLAMILKLCIDRGENNRLFQISSKDQVSYYEFAKLYSEIFFQGNGNLEKSRWMIPLLELPKGATSTDFTLYFNMDIRNVENFLYVKMPSVKESLEMTYSLYGGHHHSKAARSGGTEINFI